MIRQATPKPHKRNDVEPDAYLKVIHEAIATGGPASKIDQLPFWAFTLASF